MTVKLSTPKLLQYCKSAIRLSSAIFYQNYFGKSPLKWDHLSVRLTLETNSDSLKSWKRAHLLEIVLYGIIIPLFNLLFLKSSIDLMRQIMLIMALFLCIGMAGLARVIFCFRKEIAGGVNTLLDWETGFMKGKTKLDKKFRKFKISNFKFFLKISAHLKEWMDLERKYRLWISVLGIGVNISMVAIALAYGFAVAMVSVGMDPLYFPLESFNFPILTTPIRLWFCLKCVYCIGKNFSFLIFYHVTVFQAYLFPLKLFVEQLQKYSRLYVYHKYLQLFILHQRIVHACNLMTAVMLYYGYTVGVLVFWILIRGLDWVPVTFYAYFPILGSVGVGWICLMLTVLGYIGNQSGFFLKEMKKGNRVRYFRKGLRAARTIQFWMGSFQGVRMDSTGRFLNSLAENVTTAVLTF